MKLLVTVVLLIIGFLNQLWAYEYLRIGDVRDAWYMEDGSIEKAEISIKIDGLFATTNLCLDISTKGTYFYSGDSLEIQMEFRLPEGSIVTDLHLLIEGEMVQAGIYDRWTATQIYEDIVARRVDPALMVKRGEDTYGLNIFPLMVDLPRKVKITYQTPISRVSNEVVSVPLPNELLNLSYLEIDSIEIHYLTNDNLINPTLLEFPNEEFQVQAQHDLRSCVLLNYNKPASMTVQLQNSLSSDIFLGLGQQSIAGDRIFQLEINPDRFFNVTVGKKVLFLIDYIPNNCRTTTRDGVVNILTLTLQEHLSDQDSFNVMIAGSPTTKISSNWIPASPNAIQAAKSKITLPNNSNDKNLPKLLSDGLSYFIDLNTYGLIVLVSSSGVFGSEEQADQLTEDLFGNYSGEKPKFTILNLFEKWSPYHLINGKSHTGNDFLYQSLVNITNGNYYKLKTESLKSLFNKALIYPNFGDVDLRLHTSNGQTFFEFPIYTQSHLFTNKSMKITGKLIGSEPFKISATAILPDGALQHTSSDVYPDDITLLDTMDQAIWSGQRIKQLAISQSSYYIKNIIKESLKHRILTSYTAFLALEPEADTVSLINTETLPSYPTGISPSGHRNSIRVSVYPNPFNEFVTFKYELEHNSHVRIELYNMLGQIVSIIVDEQQSKGLHNERFLRSHIQEGVYFYRISINNREVNKGKLIAIH